jgi:hypothetical protein
MPRRKKESLNAKKKNKELQCMGERELQWQGERKRWLRRERKV